MDPREVAPPRWGRKLNHQRAQAWLTAHGGWRALLACACACACGSLGTVAILEVTQRFLTAEIVLWQM